MSHDAKFFSTTKKGATSLRIPVPLRSLAISAQRALLPVLLQSRLLRWQVCIPLARRRDP